MKSASRTTLAVFSVPPQMLPHQRGHFRLCAGMSAQVLDEFNNDTNTHQER
jgi:hypothetical protein